MPLARFDTSPCCGGDPQHIFYRAQEGRVMCGLCGHAYEAVGVEWSNDEDEDEGEDHEDEVDGVEAHVYDEDNNVTYKIWGRTINDVVQQAVAMKAEEIKENEKQEERVVLVDHKSNAPVVSVPALYSIVTGIAQEHMYSLPKYRLEEVARLTDRVRDYTKRFDGETLTKETLDAIEQDVLNVAYSMLHEGEITRS